MQARLRRGREDVVAKVQMALRLATKKEADAVLDAVTAALEGTLLEHLNYAGFTIKLGRLGKFSVRHKPSILRKIPFTGEVKRTAMRRTVRFVSLGLLRQREPMEESRELGR